MSGTDRPDVLWPPASLGVIGGGQLGRMFVQAAQRLGYRAGVLGAIEESPAAQVAHWSIVGPPDHSPPCVRSPRRPRPSPSSSRTSRPPRSAGSPGAGPSAPAGGRSG